MIDLAQSWEDAIASRDVDALCALLDADVVVVTPKGKVLTGPDEVASYFGGEGFDHLEVTHEDHDFVAHADNVRMRARQVYRWKESGEHAYDRPLEVHFRFAGDRITRVEMRIADAEAAA